MQHKLLTVVRALAPIAGALVMVANVHAAYTVVDDDLFPTKVVSAPPETLQIAFNRGAAALNPTARAFVSSLIPRLENAAKIVIVGRIDNSIATENRQQESLAQARAAALRTYLVRAGIPSSIVEVGTDLSANPLASSGISPAELIITSKSDLRATQQARAQPSTSDPTIPHEYRNLKQGYAEAHARPAPSAPTYNPPPPALPTAAAPSRSSAADQRLIEYINQAVQSGQMSPVVAIQLLRSLVDVGIPTQPVAAAPAPTAIAAYLAVPARVERWTLNAQMTLKENMDQWAQASGWRPTVWEASNFYQVTSTTTLDGAFPDVLKRVADSTGLNICAMPREKYVRVTDANVPCSK